MADRFRFVAIDPRVEDLDGTEWSSLAEIHRVVGTLLQRNGHLSAAFARPADRPAPRAEGAAA